jgi:hypothetical protein
MLRTRPAASMKTVVGQTPTPYADEIRRCGSATRVASSRCAAATREGTTLPALCAAQPDVSYLFRELEPYFTAGSDEQVHDAYMSVARGETTA